MPTHVPLASPCTATNRFKIQNPAAVFLAQTTLGSNLKGRFSRRRRPLGRCNLNLHASQAIGSMEAWPAQVVEGLGQRLPMRRRKPQAASGARINPKYFEAALHALKSTGQEEHVESNAELRRSFWLDGQTVGLDSAAHTSSHSFKCFFFQSGLHKWLGSPTRTNLQKKSEIDYKKRTHLGLPCCVL